MNAPDATTRPAVTIVIVSFNTRDITLDAIRSVVTQQNAGDYQLVVVDNASTDGSADAIEREFAENLTLIRSQENLGFGPANNLGAERAEADWILLLNPDTVVHPGAIDRLLACARNAPERGVFGGVTEFADGSLNPASAWANPTAWSMLARGLGLAAAFDRSRLFNPEPMPQWDRTTSRSVDIVSGCYLLIATPLWKKLGGFDPEFRLYAEEFDLCMRAKALGAAPFVCAESKIVHLGGASDRVRENQTVRQFAARAMLVRKHWGPLRARVAIMSLTLWAFNKRFRARARGHHDDFQVWSRIWARRDEWHRPKAEGHLRSTAFQTNVLF
jgi:N-acetylglucosaminyl-diphospho-decaprenol L-rhamnosyltransferase